MKRKEKKGEEKRKKKRENKTRQRKDISKTIVKYCYLEPFFLIRDLI